VGYQVPPPLAAGAHASASGPGGGSSSPPSRPSHPPNLDLRIPGWSVRNQGDRGTCVAHALAACREHAELVTGTKPDGLDLSEQFLFWAAKQHDPASDDDGTRLEYGAQALAQNGVCPDVDWPYDGTVRATVTHADPPHIPSATARTKAQQFCRPIGHLQSGGNAALVLRLLTSRRAPVAITLPVFADPVASSRDNWNTPVAQQYGVVINPPPTSVAVGGHAVAIVGYVSDRAEPNGGYFIFRNSWGSDWARGAPSANRHTPEPGYGQVSASYVEEYLWEVCAL